MICKIITIYLKAQTDPIFYIPCTNQIKAQLKKNHVLSICKIPLIMHLFIITIGNESASYSKEKEYTITIL